MPDRLRVWAVEVLTEARVQNGAVTASSVYTYDAVGRTASTVRTGPGGGDANYSYTSAGRLSGASWSTGMEVAYSYNSVGELTTVTPSGTGGVPAVEYAYDPSGRVSTVTRQSGTPVVTSAVYDAAGQLSSLQHSTSAGVLKGYAITRDVRGNPTQVDTTTSAGKTSALYTYDAVSRLKTECYPTTGTACVAKSPRNAYTYDLVGNRTSQTARTVSGNKATTVVTDYAYDAAYELLTKSVAGTATVTNTWTPNGALATSTTPAGTQTYTTDLTDELISVTLADGSTVGYTHDAQGNRTSRTVDGLLDATWAWDDLSSLPMRIGEYDAAGTLATAWLADPTSSTGASLAQTSGGVSSWLLNDPFANTVATVSTTGGTVSGTRTMDAFGVERTAATGSLADAAVGFAGQYLDDATGLYDMRARDYDPSSGRFTATDPVAVPTGMPYVAGYSYAFNNPLTGRDPSGLWSEPDWGQLTKGVFANEIVSYQIVKAVVEFSLPQGKKKLIDSMYNTWNENGRGLDDAWTSANANLNPMYAVVVSSANAYDNYQAGRPGDAMIDLYTAASIASLTAMSVKAPVESTCAKIRTAAAEPGPGAAAAARTATANIGTALVKYDADFAVGQLTAGGRATASQLDAFGSLQGWARSQTATGPVKFTDGNGVVRLTIKQGSPRAPGSGGPHVELRNRDGIRIDPSGNPVSRTSPGNHTPIVWDW